MAKDTVTLKADGSVSLDDFQVVLRAMVEMLSTLTAEATPSPGTVEWVVDQLKGGSAMIVGRGLPGTFLAAGAVEEVVRSYERLARKAHVGQIEEFPIPVQQAVRKLAGLVNGKITRISLSAGDAPKDWPVNR